MKKAVALGILILGVLAAFFFLYTPPAAAPSLERTIQVGEVNVRVSVADTDASRAQGLSGRKGLSEDEGMLFLFPTPEVWGFWMKDMNFSIDIIWISDSSVIVDIDERVSPDTFPTVFTPSGPVQFVLEVPAGFAAKHGIQEGLKVNF